LQNPTKLHFAFKPAEAPARRSLVGACRIGPLSLEGQTKRVKLENRDKSLHILYAEKIDAKEPGHDRD
jgi:hypothetical protein